MGKGDPAAIPDWGARAAARAAWPIHKGGLQKEDQEHLGDSTTAEQRLAMMEQLALDAWASSGQPWPNYGRAEIPLRIFRKGDGRASNQ